MSEKIDPREVVKITVRTATLRGHDQKPIAGEIEVPIVEPKASLTLGARRTGKTLANTEAALDRFDRVEGLRKQLLRFLRAVKRKCSSAQRATVNREREHVKALPNAQVVPYVAKRGPVIGFVPVGWGQ